MTSQETEPTLPVSAQESLAEAWVHLQGHQVQQSRDPQGMLAQALLKEVTLIPTIVWPQAKQQGGNSHQQKIGLKIYEHGPTYQSKT